MKDIWKQASEKSDRKHQDLQTRILRIPGSERVLTKFTKEGANREKLLSLLANAVQPMDSWRAPVRRKKRQLESIASQLETVAKHAQRISLDPLCYATFWSAFLGMGEWEQVKPVKDLAPTWIFGLMRVYAKNCRDRAKAFGTLLREQPPRLKRLMIECLLIEIWYRTRKYHDREVAFLLTNASEAAGHKRVFTEDQIKKLRQKYVSPRIEAYQRLHPATPTPGS